MTICSICCFLLRCPQLCIVWCVFFLHLHVKLDTGGAVVYNSDGWSSCFFVSAQITAIPMLIYSRTILQYFDCLSLLFSTRQQQHSFTGNSENDSASSFKYLKVILNLCNSFASLGSTVLFLKLGFGRTQTQFYTWRLGLSFFFFLVHSYEQQPICRKLWQLVTAPCDRCLPLPCNHSVRNHAVQNRQQQFL